MHVTSFNQHLCALIFIFFASTAHARIDYCVGTTAQLEAALSAADSDGDASLISLRPGSYVLTGDLNYNQGAISPEGALTLRGGAIGGTCAVSTAGADGTVIAGLFSATFFQRRGEVLIEDLTFVGVYVRITKPRLAQDTVRIQRVLMLSSLLVINAPSSEVIMRDSVIKNGADQFSVPDFGLLINASQVNAGDPERNINLINVSVLDALASVDGLGRALPVRITNSIFQRSGAELESSANLVVRNSRSNSIQMQNGATLSSSNVSTLGTQLNAQYQPLSTSPMLDRGLAGVYEGLPPFDMYGDARVVGAAVDIGGAESPVDGNGVVIVDTTATSGAGSLAAAVAFANADSAPNTIRFNIPGSTCPKRIVRTSELVITDGLVIDGYSQPGSVVPSSSILFNGEPCILLDGNARTHNGIVTGAALTANDESITIKGFAFEDFESALQLNGGSNHVVQGNQFGGSIGNTATLMSTNNRAIVLSVNDSVIGGLSSSQRNLIAGSIQQGILLTTANNNAIIENQIGYDGSGISGTAASNDKGIFISGGANNVIRGNRIGGNREHAIELTASATGTDIRNNQIGSALFSQPANAGYGVLIRNGAHTNSIGSNNIIVGNLGGVRITEDAGGSNVIERASIFNNTNLGIDLDAIGVTPNDNDSSICNVTTGCASNNNQNYPVLTSARYRAATILVPASLQIAGSLRSLVRADPYQIAYYLSASCDASGYGEGAMYLDTIDLTIANSGICAANNCTRAFNVPINPDDVAIGDSITAIAIASNGDSSEFAQCVTVTAAGGAAETIFANGFE